MQEKKNQDQLIYIEGKQKKLSNVNWALIFCSTYLTLAFLNAALF